MNKTETSSPSPSYRRLVESVEGIVPWEADPQTMVFTYVGPQAERMFGYPLSDWRRPDFWQTHLHPDDRDWVVNYCTEAPARGRDHELEYRMLAADGKIRWIRDCIAVRQTEDGQAILEGFFFDITAQKTAEAELRRARDELELSVQARTDELQKAYDALQDSERRYRTLTEASNVGIWQIDLDGNTLYTNPAMRDLLQIEEPAQLEGRLYRDFFTPESIDRMESEYTRHRPRGISSSYEVTLIGQKGRRRDVVISGSPLLDAGGSIYGLIGTFTDISKRKQAEEALRESEERWRFLIQNAPDYILNVAPDLTILFLNRSAPGFEVSELVGSNLLLLIEPADRHLAQEAFQKTRETGEPHSYEIRGYGANGETAWYRNRVGPVVRDGKVVSFLIIGTDVTNIKKGEQERNTLEAQIQHAQKLESLGVLAGGIAHDFNNLLMGILGNVGLALMEISPKSAARSYLQKIESVSLHAAELTNQMLAYSGKGKFVIQALDISKLIQDMSHLLEMVISKRAALQYELDKNLPLIEGDSAQLQQIIMNLATNASEAIGEKRGQISIRTGTTVLEKDSMSSIILDSPIPEGDYVFFEVKDDGCGMDLATQARVFDPFFTTKFMGRGLGLAATLGIVRGHRGAIRLVSQPGRGTTFTILLPAIQKKVLERNKSEPRAWSSWEGGGTILVVDDEEVIRMVVKAVLEKFGFTVLTASDGVEALELFQAHEDEILAVLLDMTMPRMSGEETFQELRRLRPDLRIILSSGFSEQETSARIGGPGLATFIQKPYQPMDLLDKLLEILTH